VRILILHGPNLNLLGRREPDRYGRVSLSEIDEQLRKAGESAGCDVECVQSNAEHELVERIHEAMDDGTDGIVINPAALTHTSVALRDALAAAALPFIEVHLTNPDARESFRRTSYLADLAVGRVAGFGPESYLLGLRGLIRLLEPSASE
jgi:3-dehydroquinate dehydratase-2